MRLTVPLLAVALVAGCADRGYYAQPPAPGTVRSGLVLLPITGHQQTTDYTCGPAAVLTLLRHYQRTGDELALATAMKTNAEIGTTPENLAGWLTANGFTVVWGENGSLDLLRDNLAKGVPTLVEWSDWGGHWALVVGYDTRGTDDIADDAIIFADPCDTHDDRVDGLTVFNAERFDYMWYDALLFGRVMKKVFVTAIAK